MRWITRDLWMWCHAYLANRLQYVAINGAVSKILPVISGVPQGSILGPLFFLIFINDIPSAIKSSMILLFADDAKNSDIMICNYDKNYYMVSSSSMYSEVEHNNISDMILLIYQKPLETNINNYKVICGIFCYFPYSIIPFLIFEKTISYRPSPCFVMACSGWNFH